MFHRIATLLVILALLLAGGATLAQEPVVFCGDLSEADCALVTQAANATASLQSGSVNFSLNLNMTNIPDAPASLSISVTGDGTASGMGSFKSLADVAPDADLAVVVPQLLDALEAFNGDLNLNITIPAELAEGGPNSIDLNLVWVNGTGYINFDALQPVTNDPSLTGWGGLEIIALVRAALEQEPELLDQLGAMSAMSGADMMGGGFDPAMIERFSDPEVAGQYMSIARVADENGLAVFETTLDFGALYSDPAFQELIQQQMESQMATSGAEMSAEEAEMALGMMNQMFENATFTIRETIDPATGFTNSVSGNIVFDMTTMLESAGESTDAGPVVFSMDFNVAFSEQDSAALVTAPAGAALFPYQMLLGMISQQPQ